LRPVLEIENGLENQVADLGFEFVDLDWAGSSVRPVLRLRVDKYDSVPGRGVTIEDCARISRELEPWLDSHESLSERYVLEVSSPGVDRPLTKTGDFNRFRGEQVALHGHEILAGRDKRLQGELLGLDESGVEVTAVRLRLLDGDEIAVPKSEIRKAHLVFKSE
jgi:ribosome maturation factor RimP